MATFCLFVFRNSRLNPTILKSFVDNGPFDILMDTAGSEIANVHDPSQGAGHTRPVNSGKLFVFKGVPMLLSICPGRQDHSIQELSCKSDSRM